MPVAAEIWTGSPVETLNADGMGSVVLVCEHAANSIPDEFGDLGLTEAVRHSHVAWDPGALAVAQGLSKALDAPLVAGTVSRLLYDCNRPPEADSAIPEHSEVFNIPGNIGLSKAEKRYRTDSIYRPFCKAISDLLATRKAKGQATALVTMHSFTPVYFGKSRSVEIGVLYDTDTRLADAMMAVAAKLPGRQVERNAPYGPQDGVTHSLKLHGLANGLANVMIEIRNDLLRSPEDEAAMTQEILTLLRPALAALAQPHEVMPNA